MVTIKNPVFDEIANFIPIQPVQRQALISKKMAQTHKTFKELLDDPQVNFMILPAAAFFFSGDEIQKLTKAGRFITAPSLQSCYQTLKRNPNAAVVQNDWVHSYFEKTQSITEHMRITDSAPTSFEIGIYYRKKENPEDIKAITQALKDIVKDGTWQKITDSYADFKSPAIKK